LPVSLFRSYNGHHRLKILHYHQNLHCSPWSHRISSEAVLNLFESDTHRCSFANKVWFPDSFFKSLAANPTQLMMSCVMTISTPFDSICASQSSNCPPSSHHTTFFSALQSPTSSTQEYVPTSL
jgi:hypothetical protein